MTISKVFTDLYLQQCHRTMDALKSANEVSAIATALTERAIQQNFEPTQEDVDAVAQIGALNRSLLEAIADIQELIGRLRRLASGETVSPDR